MNFRLWIGPSVLSAVLIMELFAVMSLPQEPVSAKPAIESKQVGIALMGPYMLGVELSSLLLTAGLIGAYHLGKRKDAAAQTDGVTLHD